jgi:hypothetical protein
MSFALPPWADRLSNLYWFLRYYGHRDQARRRKLYRRIAVERTRLVKLGIDGERVRLLCRYLANPRNRHAAERYLQMSCSDGLMTNEHRSV